MSVGIKANSDGLSGSIQLNGLDVVKFNSSGVTQGVTTTSGAESISQATDIQLTSSSAPNIKVELTTSDKSIILPNATTISINPYRFSITNSGVNTVSIKTFTGNLLIPALSSGQTATLGIVDNSTQTGTWVYNVGASTLAFQQKNINTSTITDALCIFNLIKLSDTSGVIVYFKSAGTIHAVAYTLSGDTATFGTPINLGLSDIRAATNMDTASGYIRTTNIVVSATSVVLGFAIYGNTNSSVQLVPLTISGTTITAGTVQSLVSTAIWASPFVSLCLLSTNKIGIAWSYQTNYGNGYSYVRAATISGNTLTFGADIALTGAAGSNASYYGNASVAIDRLQDDKAIILYRSYNDALIRVSFITTSGTTCTQSTAYTDSATYGVVQNPYNDQRFVYQVSTTQLVFIHGQVKFIVNYSGNSITNYTTLTSSVNTSQTFDILNITGNLYLEVPNSGNSLKLSRVTSSLYTTLVINSYLYNLTGDVIYNSNSNLRAVPLSSTKILVASTLPGVSPNGTIRLTACEVYV